GIQRFQQIARATTANGQLPTSGEGSMFMQNGQPMTVNGQQLYRGPLGMALTQDQVNRMFAPKQKAAAPAVKRTRRTTTVQKLAKGGKVKKALPKGFVPFGKAGAK